MFDSTVKLEKIEVQSKNESTDSVKNRSRSRSQSISELTESEDCAIINENEIIRGILLLIDDLYKINHVDDGKKVENLLNRINTLFGRDSRKYPEAIELLDMLNVYEFLITALKDCENNSEEVQAPLKAFFKSIIEQKKSLISTEWRLMRKMTTISKKLEVEVPSNFENQIVLKFKEDLSRWAENLNWRKKKSKATKKAIECLENLLFLSSNQEVFYACIMKGYFDKKVLNNIKCINGSIFLADNGGLFYLLNNFSVGPEDKKGYITEMLIEEDISYEYLVEKKNKYPGNKFKIGQGTFGKLRLALSLNKTECLNTAKILCVKKIEKRKKTSPDKGVYDSTLTDYFAKRTFEESNFLIRPSIYDMGIVSKVKEKEEKIKGFIFLEVLSQNDAGVVFKKTGNNEYNKWEYQKPYILKLIDYIKQLCEKRIFISDLKPSNTLYDPRSKSVSIIDLGAAKKLDEKEYNDIHISKFSLQMTVKYSKNISQDIKTLEDVYAKMCSEIFTEITNETDECYKSTINDINLRLKETNLTLDQAKTEYENIGEKINYDQTKEGYIFKMKNKLKSDPISINLKKIASKALVIIPQKVATKNPKVHKKEQAYDLPGQYLKFSQQKPQQNSLDSVFLLYGGPQSGKSFFIQRQFKQEVDEWTRGKPLPIYLKLEGTVVKLSSVIHKLNKVVGSNIAFDESLESVNLFIEHSEDFILKGKFCEFLNDLVMAKVHLRLILGIRNDGSSNLKLKIIGKGFLDKIPIFKYYLLPLKYFSFSIEHSINASINIEPIDEILKQLINKLKRKENDKTEDEIFQLIRKSEIIKYLKQNSTAFWTLKNFIENKIPVKIRDAAHVYESLIKVKANYEIEILTVFQREKICEFFGIQKNNIHLENQKQQILQKVTDLGQKIVKKMYSEKNLERSLNLERFFREEYGKEVFENSYKGTFQLKDTIYSRILRMIPILVKKPKNELMIEFFDPYYRACFILNILKGDSNQFGELQRYLLSRLDLKEESELKAFILKSKDEELKTKLREIIELTKSCKDSELVNAASTSMTLLCYCKYSFYRDNLSHTSIPGANLTGGLIYETNFQHANLERIIFKNACKNHADFKDAKMNGILDDEFKEIQVFEEKVYCVLLTPDNKYLICTIRGKLIIYDWHEKKEYKRLEFDGYKYIVFSSKKLLIAGVGKRKKFISTFFLHGSSVNNIRTGVHTKNLHSLDFSPDSSRLAVSSEDCSFSIREFEIKGESVVFSREKKCGANGEKKHASEVVKVVYSPDGKYIATACLEQQVFLWEAEDGKFYKSLSDASGAAKGRINKSCLAFSADGSKIIFSIGDRYVRVVDMKTGKQKYQINIKTTPVNSMCLNDRGILALGSETSLITFYDINEKKFKGSMKVHAKKVSALTFAPSGKSLVSGSFDKKIVASLIPREYCSKRTPSFFLPQIKGMSFDSRNRLGVFGDKSNSSLILDISASKVIKLWKHYDNDYIGRLIVTSNAFSNDGKYFIETINAGNVIIRDIESNLKVKEIGNDKTEVIKTEVLSNNTLLILSKKFLKLWSILSTECFIDSSKRFIDSSNCFDKYEVGQFPVISFYSSPKGDSVALTAGEKYPNIIIICGIHGNKFDKNKEYKHETNWEITCATYNRLGNQLYYASLDEKGAHNLHFIDLEKKGGSKVLQTKAHDKKILTLAFMGEKYLASAGEDLRIKIWNVESMKSPDVIIGHSDKITCLLYDSSQRRLFSGSFDNSIKVWQFKDDEPEELSFRDPKLVSSFGNGGNYIC